MVLTLIFAVIVSLQVNVNAAEEIPCESLKQEIEELKGLVSALQKTSEFHSLKINSLERTSEDQQRIINQQRAILEKLLVEDHGLKNKQQITVLNQENRTFRPEVNQGNGTLRPEVNQENGTLRPEVNQGNGTIRTDIGKHQTYGDSGDIRTLKERLQITESRYERLLSEPATVLPVAFYAYMSASATYSQNHHVLVFDTVKTNIGNSFHHTTGVFMVPAPGLYAFTWTIREYNGSHHSVALVVNNEEYGAVYQNSHALDYDQCSTSVVLHLNQGDDVYLRTRVSGGDGVIVSNPYGRTSFSGWKIN